jgi:glycosyltransferase involved in cell wall biosynthesis
MVRKYIRVFQNPRNMGMDGNFNQAVLHGQGEYVWLSGQDDIFEPGAIDKLFSLLQAHPDLDLVYLNYRFLSGDLSREVSPPLLSFRDDRIFNGAQDFFRSVDSAPSFLPATVIRRRFWEHTDVEPYLGTHYVQVAVWLLNGANSKIAAVGDPKFISCRMPEESWKFNSGKMLFETITGKFFVYKKVHELGESYVPDSILQWFDTTYFQRFVRNIIVLKSMGLAINAVHKSRVRFLSHGRLHYYLFLWLGLAMPQWLSKIIMSVYRLRGQRVGDHAHHAS